LNCFAILLSQKGFDLIATIAERLAALDLYVVALGTGEPAHEELFRTWRRNIRISSW